VTQSSSLVDCCDIAQQSTQSRAQTGFLAIALLQCHLAQPLQQFLSQRSLVMRWLLRSAAILW
jgi:hypothetical protein